MNFDYYFNIFQPDCVVLETAEYATNGAYFSYETLWNKELNPKLDIEGCRDGLIPLQNIEHTVEEDGSLITVSLYLGENIQQAYLIIGDHQFDFSVDQENQTAECTIDIQYFQEDSAQVFFQ